MIDTALLNLLLGLAFIHVTWLKGVLVLLSYDNEKFSLQGKWGCGYGIIMCCCRQISMVHTCRPPHS